jgi:hypothetical protein
MPRDATAGGGYYRMNVRDAREFPSRAACALSCPTPFALRE